MSMHGAIKRLHIHRGRTSLALALVLLSHPAFAQTSDPVPASEQAEAYDAGDIIVTATKKAGGETVQQAPLALTALDSKILQTNIVHNLRDLSYSMPNVQLDNIGTQVGVVNFPIRGLGTNTTVVTFEPYAGLFVDGVYIGVQNGAANASFDLGSVEVLRGPQGVLFGRNVVGGAVLLNTSDPTNELTGNFRVGVESGPNLVTNGTVSGPLIKDLLAVKLAAYYNYDDGYFRNRLTDRNFGKRREFVVRPGLMFTPGDVTFKVKLEYGKQSGEGQRLPELDHRRNL